MKQAPSIIDHIERHLGSIQESWSKMPEGGDCPFQVVLCAGGVEDTMFFCTLGLGSFAFRGAAGRPARHEVLMAVPESFGIRNVPALVQQLGMIALNRSRPFVHGEVIGGGHPVFPRRPFRGFFVSPPCVIADDAFEDCRNGSGDTVWFAWLVPLYQREIDFARRNGFSRLEDLFIAQSLDLVDMDRKSAVN